MNSEIQTFLMQNGLGGKPSGGLGGKPSSSQEDNVLVLLQRGSEARKKADESNEQGHRPSGLIFQKLTAQPPQPPTTVHQTEAWPGLHMQGASLPFLPAPPSSPPPPDPPAPPLPPQEVAPPIEPPSEPKPPQPPQLPQPPQPQPAQHSPPQLPLQPKSSSPSPLRVATQVPQSPPPEKETSQPVKVKGGHNDVSSCFISFLSADDLALDLPPTSSDVGAAERARAIDTPFVKGSWVFTESDELVQVQDFEGSAALLESRGGYWLHQPSRLLRKAFLVVADLDAFPFAPKSELCRHICDKFAVAALGHEPSDTAVAELFGTKRNPILFTYAPAEQIDLSDMWAAHQEWSAVDTILLTDDPSAIKLHPYNTISASQYVNDPAALLKRLKTILAAKTDVRIVLDEAKLPTAVQSRLDTPSSLQRQDEPSPQESEPADTSIGTAVPAASIIRTTLGQLLKTKSDRKKKADSPKQSDEDLTKPGDLGRSSGVLRPNKPKTSRPKGRGKN